MTIKEIAKLANVSLGTVDRVIHKRGKVSKKTEKKILDIIEKVNYQPNIYARGLVLNKSYQVAALVPSYSKGEYWEIPSKGIEMAAKNFSQFGIKLTILEFDQNSAMSFNKKAEELLKMNVDGAIIAPVINFEAVKLTKKLNEASIPFTLIDSNIKNSGCLKFIGQDAFQSGKLAAKLLCAEIKPKGTISIISVKNNENHNRTLQQRIEGFKEYLYSRPFINDITLVESNINLGSKDFDEQLKSACNPNNDTVGIYVPSSLIHYLAKHIESSALSNKVKLIGNDLISKNVEYLEKETITYLLGQRPKTQGYLALESFYNHLVLNKKIDSEKFLPIDIITQENLMYYDTNLNNLPHS
ncbi:substrate-binding domain-containing protein [Joostella atrarenae]|uniref:Substrate-binding domain-containing protein n=1 Tax=Joostella atrarenae TaxID=679257 RepID=A0ABS9J3Y6_9FLAO|nr:substrate-binding domain-containing protein [Joostella atrarenae]MCF8715130.1 substrate-binding domain-containing protein [Joostella atrarenae]